MQIVSLYMYQLKKIIVANSELVNATHDLAMYINILALSHDLSKLFQSACDIVNVHINIHSLWVHTGMYVSAVKQYY